MKKKNFKSIQCTLNSVLTEGIINGVYCIYGNKVIKHQYLGKLMKVFMYLYKTMF